MQFYRIRQLISRSCKHSLDREEIRVSSKVSKSVSSLLKCKIHLFFPQIRNKTSLRSATGGVCWAMWTYFKSWYFIKTICFANQMCFKPTRELSSFTRCLTHLLDFNPLLSPVLDHVVVNCRATSTSINGMLHQRQSSLRCCWASLPNKIPIWDSNDRLDWNLRLCNNTCFSKHLLSVSVCTCGCVFTHMCLQM